eukprot:TRINITY_DN22631_c0_g1_i3.p1 TRINITY_DN22631_c0_g1~~TRINITY_DN22631_c0_g1_i3.p1  ORF type:complete len:519 (+),score=125.51 TRINITY_DN22631_c0_g1_i3:208-1764(+)
MAAQAQAVPSAKAQGIKAPSSMDCQVGDMVDGMDKYFKWYAAHVVEEGDNQVLVHFGSWPEERNEWLGLESGRLAPCGHFTDGKLVNETELGVTADMAIGDCVEVLHDDMQKWIPCTVSDVSDDGEYIQVPNQDEWVCLNHGRVRIYWYRQFNVTNVAFEVWNRYTDPKFIGQGAYGCVISAADLQSVNQTCSADASVGKGEFGDVGRVAIKKIIDIQDMDEIDAMRTLREIKICRHLTGHENVTRILEVFPSTQLEPFNEVYLVFELMPTDLSRLIRGNQLQNKWIASYSYQIIKALKFIHSAGIMHRDIKPSNILVNPERGTVQVADFGLAIGKAGSTHQLINYVVTRWYRAPELLLDNELYNGAIDMWSVGCIIIEMLLRKPLLKGKSSKDQLRLILSLLGKPCDEDCQFIQKDKYREMLLKMTNIPPVPWERVMEQGGVLEGADTVCLDFVDCLLRFSPDRRLSAPAALEHPYFEDFHDPDDEPECDQEFGFVTEDLQPEQVYALIREESLLIC